MIIVTIVILLLLLLLLRFLMARDRTAKKRKTDGAKGERIGLYTWLVHCTAELIFVNLAA